MSEKKARKDVEMDKIAEIENKQIEEIKTGIAYEKRELDANKEKTREEFKRWNDDFLNQLKLKKEMEQETSKFDNEEFFPYVHGDLIEQQRHIMNQQLAVELKGHYQQAIREKSEKKSNPNLERYKLQNITENRSLLSSHGQLYHPAPTEAYPVFLKPHD